MFLVDDSVETIFPLVKATCSIWHAVPILSEEAPFIQVHPIRMLFDRLTSNLFQLQKPYLLRVCPISTLASFVPPNSILFRDFIII